MLLCAQKSLIMLVSSASWSNDVYIIDGCTTLRYLMRKPLYVSMTFVEGVEKPYLGCTVECTDGVDVVRFCLTGGRVADNEHVYSVSWEL